MAKSPLQLKTLKKDLLKCDEIPLLGTLTPFPKEAFEKAVRSLFQFNQVSMKTNPFEWIPFEKATEGLAAPFKTFTLASPSFEGNLYFLLSDQEIEAIMSLILKTKTLDPELNQEFAPFIAFTLLNTLKELSYPPGISLQCSFDESLKDEPYLCQNVTITLNDRPFSGRLLLSKTFQSSIKKHFQGEVSNEAIENIKLNVSLEAGKTHLTLAEWEAMKPGDWLLLDECSLESDATGGKVLLTHQKKPLFRGKIKEGNLKILEHPLAYKEE